MNSMVNAAMPLTRSRAKVRVSSRVTPSHTYSNKVFTFHAQKSLSDRQFARLLNTFGAA